MAGQRHPSVRQKSGEISSKPTDERLRVRRDDVQLTLNVFRLSRRQSADAKIVVHARDHALKDLLVWVPNDGQDRFLVGGIASGQAAYATIGSIR